MVRKLNHYKVLGVAPNASEEDVKKAYRSLVRTAHPDKGGSTERFQRIQKSYESILQKITTTSAIIQKANETENSKEKKNREGRRTREGNGDSCGDVKQRREKGRATFEKSEKEGRKIDESETNIDDAQELRRVTSDAPYSWRAKTILKNTNRRKQEHHRKTNEEKKAEGGREEEGEEEEEEEEAKETNATVLEIREDAADSQPLVNGLNLEKIGDDAMVDEDFSRARECYTQALAFSKLEGLHRYAELYHKRALCHRALGEYEDGLSDAEKSCSFRRLWVDPYLTCGDILERLERWSAALKSYRESPTRDASPDVKSKVNEGIARCEERMRSSSSMWVVENAHEGGVKRVAVKSIPIKGNESSTISSSDYTYLIATCGGDKFINVWSADGEKIARLKCLEDVADIKWNDAKASGDDIEADHDSNVNDTVENDMYLYEDSDVPTLAIIGRNNTALIWKNMVPGMKGGDERVLHLNGFHDEKASITACAFSPVLFSNRLATADSNGKIAVWDCQTGSLECTTKYHHRDVVNGIAWHPQTGASLTTVSNDGDGRVFDIDGDIKDPGGCLHTLRWMAKQMTHVVYTNCGRLILTSTCDVYANSGRGAYRILVWSSVSGRLCKWYDDHSSKITSLSWHPNPGTRNILMTGAMDGILRCFSIRASPSGAGKALIQQDEKAGDILKLAGEKWTRTTSAHNCVKHNEYGGYIAVASDDSYVRVYSSDAIELKYERKCGNFNVLEQCACVDLAWLTAPISTRTDNGLKQMSFWGLVTATSTGELRMWKIPRNQYSMVAEDQNYGESENAPQTLESCTWWDPNENADEAVPEKYKNFQIQSASRRNWHYLGPGMNDKLEHKALILKGSSEELQCDVVRDDEVTVSDALLPGDGEVSEENLEAIENEMQMHMAERRNFMKDTRNCSKSKRTYHENYCEKIKPLRERRGRIYRNLKYLGMI
jgi:WD40 repeat protein